MYTLSMYRMSVGVGLQMFLGRGSEHARECACLFGQFVYFICQPTVSGRIPESASAAAYGARRQ